MEQISLGYSLKDISVPEDKVVLEKVISSWEVTGKKMKFQSNPQCRLLNPTKSELGKVSKKMLERINSELRGKTKLRQWRRTRETRDWFDNLEEKQELTFIKFDVESFYPSISDVLLKVAFETRHGVPQQEKGVLLILLTQGEDHLVDSHFHFPPAPFSILVRNSDLICIQ